MKKQRFICLCLIICMILTGSGCAKDGASGDLSHDSPEKNPAQTGTADISAMEKKTLPEIREEADRFEGQYVNLDLSDTVIRIPDVDTLADVTFPVSKDALDRQVEKFEDNIRKYEGLDADKDLTPYMRVLYWDDDEKVNDQVEIPFSEATPENTRLIQYLSYNDGICSELVVFSNFMLEMGNYKAVTAITGDTEDHSHDILGYRAVGLGTSEAVYHLPEDDISGIAYHLSDGDMPLQEAVDYVEQHIREDYYFAGSGLLDYHVASVDVRKLDDDTYYYYFRIYPSYRGVNFSREDYLSGGGDISGRDADAESTWKDPEPFVSTHQVSMFRCGQMDFLWTSCHSYESASENQVYSEILSLQDACALLSAFLSAKREFVIDSVELIYHTDFTYAGKEKWEYGYVDAVHAWPAYHFTVSNPPSDYGRLSFDVDAVTGKIVTMGA